MRLHTLLASSLLIALTACGGGASALEPAAGWVIDFRGDTPAPVVPAVEALAWRYDNSDGLQTTDIWISGVALTPEQRQQLRPARSGLVSDEARTPDALGLPGIVFQVNDQGAGEGMIHFCWPTATGVECNGGSGLGTVLVNSFDAQSIRGAFYTRDPKGALYAAPFDAKIVNEASVPLATDVQWNADGGEAGKAYIASNQAALDGDLETLKRHAMPERIADYDEPSTLKLVQRMAHKKPAVLSARTQGNGATLWVRDTVADGTFSPGVVRVDMQRVDGSWRVVGLHMN